MMTRNMLLCTSALVALAACNNSSNDGFAGPVASLDEPLGLTFDTAVNVMSADREDGNTVTVSAERATVTLNDLVIDNDGDIDSFSVTLGLPDGTSVTVTEDDIYNGGGGVGEINGQAVVLANLNTDRGLLGNPTGNGDEVEVLIGLGLGTPDPATEEEVADNALFVLARVDQAEPTPADGEDPIADQGFNVYMVTGEETDTLPSGSATYSGDTVATAYVNNELVDATLSGHVNVLAEFADSTVDIELRGAGQEGTEDGDLKIEYTLYGNDIPVEGSRYQGTLGDAATGPLTSVVKVSEWGLKGPTHNHFDHLDTVAVDGDVLGAFFGENAEATAGVFGAEQTASETTDVEIVGGFAAYDDDPDQAATAK